MKILNVIPGCHYCHNRHVTPYSIRLTLYSSVHMPNPDFSSSTDRAIFIDAWLPQTQCTRCGYPSCHAYAEAIAAGDADIDQCPPGGEVTIVALAQLLGIAPKSLNPAFGPGGMRQRAVIDEAACIGCRKCLEVCPVDAILGARKLMHSVLDAECNGCRLCLPACPVDCIALVAVIPPATPDSPWPDYSATEVAHWRRRSAARLARLKNKKPTADSPTTAAARVSAERERRRAEIRAAVARVHARKAAAPKRHG